MATKFQDFLSEKKINPSRLVAASRQIERLRPSDRAIKLAYLQARKKDDGQKPTGLDKPRSGRVVSAATLDKAMAGKPVSGPAKTRILRAINRILEQRKQEPVAVEAIF